MAASFDITKISKLSSRNYCVWRNILEDVLILKDLWLHIDEQEPALNTEEHRAWLKSQKHILAILRLTCEPDIVPLIADASTGTAAWKTLASTFASRNSTNVMRLEEAFGSARKTALQSMGEWISCVKSLVAQLRGVGVILEDSKVANRILNGFGKKYESMKHALQARPQPLTVEVVTEHLLSWDATQSSSSMPLPALPANTPGLPYWVASVPTHNNPHRGPMATAMNLAPDPASNTTASASPCPTCMSRPGPTRASPSHSYRYNPYASTACSVCSKLGHHHSCCWVRFPHLRPPWAQPPEHRHAFDHTPRTVGTPGSSYSAHLAMDYLPVPPAPPMSEFAFQGPDNDQPSTDFAFPTLHESLVNRSLFSNEYCFTLRDSPHLLSLRPPEGSLHPSDAPGMWLVDSGASCHYSPFFHLFLSLTPIEPPLRILTGNGFLTASFKGPIPLIIRANAQLYFLHLEDVLFVPGLQSRVNLFSVVVLADTGVLSTFGPDNVTFTAGSSVLASGTRIGNSWWLDADVRSHHLYMTVHQQPQPQSEDLWHQRMGHLNRIDLLKLQQQSHGILIGNPSIPVKSSSNPCVACLIGKQHRTISYFPRSSPTSRLSCLHVDICGPMQSYGYIAKHLYASVVVDEFSRFAHTYCLASKDELRNCLMEHIALVERSTRDRIKAIFSDNEPVLL